MNPAFSVIFFTVLSGASQGIAVVLALMQLTAQPGRPMMLAALGCALVLSVVGLGCSFLHLGRPERAWRAVLMWRTSWLSREVIAMPAYIGVLALWWMALWQGHPLAALLMGVLALVLSAVLWVCTGMIYKCIRFIAEWAHWLTLANYALIGLASGTLVTAVLAVAFGPLQASQVLQWCALALLGVAAAFRICSLRRNARLVPLSTLQSATGIRAPNLRQTSMGMTGGAFNTREFFHGKSAATLQLVKPGFLLLGFALPMLAIAASLWTNSPIWLVLALAMHVPGIVAERWFFFAQARHPQNLYYQVVS